MRVIAGAYRRRLLSSPSWVGLRPTSDRLRETLFNVLGPAVEGARVVDGFAGTGAIGIEALSRGAAHVTFVDRDRRATALVSTNLNRCGVSERYDIVQSDFSAWAAQGASTDWDVVLLDPPYDDADLARILEAARRIIKVEGVVVLEHARRREVPRVLGGLKHVREIRSGDSMLAFYRQEGANVQTKEAP